MNPAYLLIFIFVIFNDVIWVNGAPQNPDDELISLIGDKPSSSALTSDSGDSEKQQQDGSIFDYFPGQPLETIPEHAKHAQKCNPLVPGALIIGRYQTVEILNCGAFGAVIKAIDLGNSPNNHLKVPVIANGNENMVAIKVIFPVSDKVIIEKPNGKLWKPAASEEDIDNELQILTKISNAGGCSHCLPVLDNFKIANVQYLVMPIMQTSFHDIIYPDHSFGQRLPGLTWYHLKSIARQLFSALKCLHNLNIVHNDIKADNIMLNYDAYLGHYHVNLIDFGLSSNDDGHFPWRRVTPYYEAPEISLFYRGSNMSDIWSLGLVLAESVYKRPIFPMDERQLKFRMYAISEFYGGHKFEGNPRNVNDMLAEGADNFQEEAQKFKLKGYSLLNVDKFLRNSSDSIKDHEYLKQFRDLVLKCLQIDPKLRITAEQALSHPFMSII